MRRGLPHVCYCGCCCAGRPPPLQSGVAARFAARALHTSIVLGVFGRVVAPPPYGRSRRMGAAASPHCHSHGACAGVEQCAGPPGALTGSTRWRQRCAHARPAACTHAAMVRPKQRSAAAAATTRYTTTATAIHGAWRLGNGISMQPCAAAADRSDIGSDIRPGPLQWHHAFHPCLSKLMTVDTCGQAGGCACTHAGRQRHLPRVVSETHTCGRRRRRPCTGQSALCYLLPARIPNR